MIKLKYTTYVKILVIVVVFCEGMYLRALHVTA